MLRVEKSIDSIEQFMIDSHRRLEAVAKEVLDACAADAPDFSIAWSKFERDLRAHLEAEERYILPAFARADREEAMRLLREHGQIREHLLEIGVAIDLHCMRLEASTAFMATLRAHAQREEQLMYRWAETKLDVTLVEAVRLFLSRRWT
jgi:hemerythrin superfamily protein